MFKIFFLLINLLIFSFTLLSQSRHAFKEGMVLPLELQYGREALVQDLLAYHLFNGTFTYPSADNNSFSVDKETLTWTPVQVDSTGNFAGESLSEGYLYLSYESNEEKKALINVSGHNMLFFNGQPHGGDIYKSGWLNIPVQLKKGKNDILIRCSRWARWQGIQAQLIFPTNPVAISTEDPTLPHIIIGKDNSDLTGAVVVINTSEKQLDQLVIRSKYDAQESSMPVPSIPPMTSRKVPFKINGSKITEKGAYQYTLQLLDKSGAIDEKEITIDAVTQEEHYSHTFISEIDGSVQYYSVTPQKGENKEAPALFLSVHGAGVEAIGQARAYDSKDWGVLVAATNRRPRGFNWEDWGRIDALEVLDLAKEKFKPDPSKIYLTGHSMGGHGTWYLGATYPDKWAAIGPCAGYPTLSTYGSADGKIPDSSRLETEKKLLQASNPSDVIEMINNFNPAGIYIHHGDSDKVVSVDYAREMRNLLGGFHKDFSYYEYPGGSHWFGDESVDWPPMFDYFRWHTIPADSAIDVVDFTLSNPAIGARYFWVEVLQQEQSLKFSKVNIRRSKPEKFIKGTTSNVSTLAFDLHNFEKGDTIQIMLDEMAPLTYVIKSGDDRIHIARSDKWSIVKKPDATEKGPHRGGTFKEAFNHRMIFVYGTGGNAEENQWAYEKAVYDAEVWYYRGNGAVDIVADKNFNPSRYPDRGIILYGNAQTNKAWKKLLKDCPVQVRSGGINVGNKKYTGDDLAAYFMWPRADSKIASIGVVSGSGLKGMKATEANQYFAAASGFPDFMIFSLDMLRDGPEGIKSAGFYTNDWKIDEENSTFQNE